MKRMIMTLALAGAMSFALSPQTAQADSLDRTVGTLIGAVSGGLIGSTIGKGDGRTVATAAGSVIGAVIGNRVVSGNNWEDDRDDARVVYRDRPKKHYERVKYVKVKEVHPRYKKWTRVARYDDEILMCHEPSGRCHWVD